MDISHFHAQGQAVVAAPPEAVYDFIADMPAIGEVSPQCVGGRWEGEERGVGAFFVGKNQAGKRIWKARQQIVVADRPREFAWHNVGDPTVAPTEPIVPLVRWGYAFEAVDGGTLVTESWRIVHAYSQLEAAKPELVDNLPQMMRDSIDTTLANLQARFAGAGAPA